MHRENSPAYAVLRASSKRSLQLTLLTSLAFGAVLGVFSAPLTAQTSLIPNLSGYETARRDKQWSLLAVRKGCADLSPTASA
jgi:hypothetical protein